MADPLIHIRLPADLIDRIDDLSRALYGRDLRRRNRTVAMLLALALEQVSYYKNEVLEGGTEGKKV